MHRFWSALQGKVSSVPGEGEETQGESSFYSAVYAHVVGNLATLGSLALIYFCYILFEQYLGALIWAVVFAIALFPMKTKTIRLIHTAWQLAREEHSRLATRIALIALLAFSLGRLCAGAPQPLLSLTLTILLGSLYTMTVLAQPLHCYAMDDHTFVALMLLFGGVVISAVACVFFSVKIQSEFAGATYSVAAWLDTVLGQEEISGVNITEQLITGQKMILTQMQTYQDSLNGTNWGPALQRVYVQLERSSNRTGTSLEMTQGWLNAIAHGATSNTSATELASMAWEEISASENLKASLKEAGVGAAETMLATLTTLLSLLATFAGIGTQAILFFTVLFYALSNDTSPIEEMSNFMPVPECRREELRTKMETAIEKVLFLPVVVAVLNGCIGLVVFVSASVLGGAEIDFVYFGTFMIFWTSVCPLVQPYLVPLPWVLALVVHQRYFSALYVFAGIYACITSSNAWVYDGVYHGISPYFTALSIVLGLSAFGVSGVVIGPFLLCVIGMVDDQVKSTEVGHVGACPTGTPTHGLRHSQRDSE
eukprot:TRINITY_DN18800_c0_g1_i1.p1 TRINITY_DN18800_c0_g1~~TRINITY_DN18800_c0_g1_i1.p1  ORF type:complete len:540 (+),score=140.56 TRINITY_DN18800_c0_g1_i1:138-1757(+)